MILVQNVRRPRGNTASLLLGRGVMKTASHHGNVLRLAVAQALSMTTMNVNIINTALVGALLSPVAGYYTSVVIAVP